MIRPAEPADVPAVLALVRALAAYEREPDAVAMTEADLAAALFGPHPAASALVAAAPPRDVVGHGAEHRADRGGGGSGTGTGDGGGEVVGFAIWHETFSTWTGQTGAFLVDLFVAEDHRRDGHGRALLVTLADICRRRGHRRLEWDVLDWNTPAHGFYRSLGAAPRDGWSTWRLDAAAIDALAARPAG